MNDRDWEKFFALLEKIINIPGSWQEKRDEVRSSAESEGCVNNLDEFLSWFQYYE